MTGKKSKRADQVICRSVHDRIPTHFFITRKGILSGMNPQDQVLTALRTLFIGFQRYEAADIEIQSVDVVFRELCKSLRFIVSLDPVILFR